MSGLNPSVTLTDSSDDDLELSISSGRLRIEAADGDTNYFVFDSDDTPGALRALRDFANEALGEKSVPGPRASEVSFNEGVMRLAAVHGKPVSFRYAKGDGKVIEQRKLLPESVFANKQGDLLFGGQDPDRDEYRAYRVDRIKGEVTVG